MKKTSVLSVCLLLVLIMTTTAACGSSSGNNTTAQSTSAAASSSSSTGTSAPEKITLTLMAESNAAQGPWQDMELFKELEKLTNIHMEFDVISDGFVEKKNLALASGELPDIFYYSLSMDDEESYGPQGYLLPLNGLIDSDGPNIKAAMEKYPEMRKSMTATDGNIYALGNYTYTMTQGSYKMFINKPWLEKLGLTMPQTTDEFYNVLKAFKENDPNGDKQANEIPMSVYTGDRTHSNPWLNGYLMTAFGYNYGYDENSTLVCVRDGKVVFPATTDGYKAFLQFLNKLYKEQLLDNSMFSQTAEEYTAKTKTQMLGVLGDMGEADWHNYTLLPPLTSQYNDTKRAIPVQRIGTGSFAITKVNKYPERSIQWADYFYRDTKDAVNGISGISIWIGREGVEWQFNADKSAVDYIIKPDEGLSAQATIQKHVAPGYGIGTRVLEVPFSGDLLANIAKENSESYYPFIQDEDLYPSGIRFGKDAIEMVIRLRTDISTYVTQMQAKFIIGEEPFDNWNKYVDILKNMKVDELVKLYQDAYDVYNK